MEKKIILKSLCMAFIGGDVSMNDYRWMLKLDRDNPKLSTLHIEQKIRDNWSGCPSGWYLATLVEDAEGAISDQIAIDAGQEWIASGLKNALIECMDLIFRNTI